MRGAFLTHQLEVFGRGEWYEYRKSERDLGEMRARKFFKIACAVHFSFTIFETSRPVAVYDFKKNSGMRAAGMLASLLARALAVLGCSLCSDLRAKPAGG